MDKKSFFLHFLCVVLIFFTEGALAGVDTRLTFVSNIYHSPVIGQGTLVIDVEATYNLECPPAIKLFQDAFKLDEVLSAQVLTITFSNQLFQAPSYSRTEDFNRDLGRVRYIYNYSSGSMVTIYENWTTIVRITIVYTMINATTSISWYDGSPEYLVRDYRGCNITGIEYPIPYDLKDISLPVVLSSFVGESVNGTITLRWITESELNNLGFEIRRAMECEGEYQLISSYRDNPQLRGKGNSTTRCEYTYTDQSVSNGHTYWYKLIDVDTRGFIFSHGPICVQANLGELLSLPTRIPAEFNLHQNYPNPFNPRTTIRFDIPGIESGATDARLCIFNSLGNLVKVLYDGKIGSGSFEVEWDGICDSGILAPSGIYFVNLQAAGHNRIMRMTLVK